MRRHIATGGMASVWCAEDQVLGRSVAVKILSERFAHDQMATRRFQREARAAARVSNHAHVVTIYDVGELEPDDTGDPDPPTRAFIVMEYLAGGTVADAIHHDAVRQREAMRWLGEAAAALDHAHGRGIVHRDIKPANFLLDRQRVLHVADFGIARLTTEDTITTADQLFGTAAYLSPEQALGREATGASDRYALAVAAFELLVGERPFSAPHFSTQARQHIEEPPPAASELNRALGPAVDEVLFDGLAKDPADRPATAGAFVRALDDALTGHASRPGRPRRPAPRPSAGGPLASTAAAVGAAAAATAATSAADPSDPGLDDDTTPDSDDPTIVGRRTHGPSDRPPTATHAATGGEAPRRRRAIALTALVVTIAVIAGIALAATSGSGSHPTRRAAALTVTHTTIKRVSPRPKATHTSATTPSSTATPESTPTATTPPPTTAAQLQSTGHAEMLQGNYASAIPTLRHAVDTSPQGSLTRAYALYDLGYSMVQSGDPAGAIPVLQQRLRFPNQTDTVRALLDRAYAAAQGHGTSDGAVGSTGTAPASNATAPSTPTTPTTPASGPGRGDAGGGPSGGAGITPHVGRESPGHSGEAPGHQRGHGHGNGHGRSHGDALVQLVTAAAGR